MKILILAHPRSGSTVFLRWLSEELKINMFNEPLNPRENMIKPIGSNYIVKELYGHILESKINVSDYLDEFDLVIGLYRQNIKDTLFSISHANKTKVYHSPYVLSDDEITKYEVEYKKGVEGLLVEQNIIKKNSDFFVTYEGIYEDKTDIEKLKNYFKISDFRYLWMIDKRNRYRQSELKII